MVFQDRNINQHINMLRNDLGIPGASAFVFSAVNAVFFTFVKYFVVIPDTLCIRGKSLHFAFILLDGIPSVQEMVFKPVPDNNLFFEDTRAVYPLNNLINNDRMCAELRSTERVDFYANDVVGQDDISPRLLRRSTSSELHHRLINQFTDSVLIKPIAIPDVLTNSLNDRRERRCCRGIGL